MRKPRETACICWVHGIVSPCTEQEAHDTIKQFWHCIAMYYCRNKAVQAELNEELQRMYEKNRTNYKRPKKINMRGVIKSYSKYHGYGFITADNGIDYFFHANGLMKPDDARAIKCGAIVIFSANELNDEREPTRSDTYAADVIILDTPEATA